MQWLAEREDVTVVMATPVPEIVEGLAHRVAVLRGGELIAYDTPEHLQSAASLNTLSEVLEHLVSPKTLDSIEHYFEGRAS